MGELPLILVGVAILVAFGGGAGTAVKIIKGRKKTSPDQ